MHDVTGEHQDRPFDVEFTSSAKRDMKRLKKTVGLEACKRIFDTIQELETDPFPPGHERLTNQGGFCRIRVGAYRAIYSVSEASMVVTVSKVAHRRDVYRH